MTRVLAAGVFNILHPGHVLFLEEAKKLGDELVVIVSSDKIAQKAKKKPLLPQEQRARMVGALKPVDRVFIGDDEDTMKLLPVIRPDVIALGHDQKVDENQLEAQLAARGIDAQIVRIRAKVDGELASSSGVLKKLSSRF
jgi:FAD synthetase